MAKLPPKPLVSEVLDAVHKAKTKSKKIEVLREYDSKALRYCLIINFDESIVSALPDGDVPYTPNPSPTVDSVSKLASEYRTLYNFVKGGNNELSGTRREVLFIQLLESLMPSEAEVLCLVKDKKLGKKYRCSFPVVSEAYPDIVWGNRT
jgi:hypothetical protein|tara:strand:- start:721 stop:1170 length:450 start_codon:yes stop_codon:yes gene_type:complete